MSSRAAGYLITAIAWLVLAGSMFLPRADDFFYEVEANLLYQYEPVGVVIIVILVLLVPLTILAVRGLFLAGLAVTVLWLLALALTLWAAFHLGTHATDGGDMSDKIAAGSILSIIAAAAGLLSAFFSAPARPATKA